MNDPHDGRRFSGHLESACTPGRIVRRHPNRPKSMSAALDLVFGQYALLRTSYVLRRLRFRAFFDSLQFVSSVVVSLLHSLRFFVQSRCTWKSSSATSWPSSIDHVAGVFASYRPIESCGRGSRTPGPAGTRPFTRAAHAMWIRRWSCLIKPRR